MLGMLAVIAVTVIASGIVWAQVGMKSTTVLQTSTTAIGQPIQFPPTRNQLVGVIIEIAPGGQVGRHLHPVPNFVYVLEGEITIEAEGHPVRIYASGQAFVESTNTWHDGFNRGTVPVKILVVFAAEEGKPVTVRP
jgi:quercetin dioxygenase-like cupin family protein